MRHARSAALLLSAGLLAAYAWQLGDFTPAVRGQVWNVSGAGLRLVLLGFVAVAYPSRSMRAVCALLATFDVMVAGCGVAFLWRPWPIVPGQSCAAQLHLPLGVLGALAGLALMVAIVRGPRD